MCDLDDGEAASLWSWKFPKARKSHRCDTCGKEITRGERYGVLFSIFEGSCSTAKQCLECKKTGEVFGQDHRFTPHPDSLFEALQECILESAESEKKWGPELAAMRARRVVASGTGDRP